jgi:putative transposase
MPKPLELESISASEVSRIAKKLDKQVKEFLNRPIAGIFIGDHYMTIIIDAPPPEELKKALQ